MPKRLTISLLGFLAGVAGNLIAGWLQQGKWSILFTAERFSGTIIGVVIILFIVALLENERALSWNWRWHRFWYLRELLKNRDLRRWETDFARLEMVQGKRKISSTEVIAEGNRQDMIEVLREAILDGHKNICRALVLGEPGSGKTTGLERLTLDLASIGSKKLGIGSKIPVLVLFGNFQQGKLLDYITQIILRSTKGNSGKILSNGFENLAKRGQMLLLCDAIDEALGERREMVLAELADFLESPIYQNISVVITSRKREDPGRRLKGLTIYEIQDLNDEAVNTFICAYKQKEHIEEEITQRLHDHRLLDPKGLGRNPFWLRLIIESGAFDGNKGQILNIAVQTLMVREWDEKPSVERSWRRVLPRDEQLEKTKSALAFLGYWMSEKNLTEINQLDILFSLHEWLAKHEQLGTTNLRPQDVLGLARDAQILIYEPTFVKFRHRLLQEFMTAWMLMIDEDLLNQKIDRCSKDVEWWETLFLLGGLLFARCNSQAYNHLALRVQGDGKNDQRQFAAIGLLSSVTNPPEELSKIIMRIFIDAITEKLTPSQEKAAQEFERILGYKAINVFCDLLHHSDIQIKIKGAALLYALKNQHTNNTLLSALLKSEKSELAFQIFSAIGASPFELLNTALHDPDKEIRKLAANALGELGDHRAVDPLITTLCDSDFYVQSSAITALGKIGSPAIEPLIHALKSRDYPLNDRAADALGKIGAAAIEPLISALYQSENKYHIAFALGQIGAPAVETLINLISKCKLTWLDWNKHYDGLVMALGMTCDFRAINKLSRIIYSSHGPGCNSAIDALMYAGLRNQSDAIKVLEDVVNFSVPESESYEWKVLKANPAWEALKIIRKFNSERQKFQKQIEKNK